MNDDETRASVGGFAVGALITLICFVFLTTLNGDVRKLAIEHGCGCYDPVTGKFEWVKRVDSDRPR